MLARFAVLVLTGIVVSGLLAAGSSRGLTQSVDVIVLVDPLAADYGTTVNVTVHVFDRGVPADPSEISAITNKLPGVAPLTLVRQSVGVFQGAFVFESYPTFVTVNATVAGIQDSGSQIVLHAFSFDRVRIVPSAGVVRPGQIVRITVETYDTEGGFQDADALNVTADLFLSTEFARRSPPTVLNWSRTAVGQYSASYLVPRGIDRDALLDFRADVAFPNGEASVGAQVYVDLPDPFLIWYRTVAGGVSNATLEIDVALPNGDPISDAAVSLRYEPWPGNGSTVVEGTTDALGAVRFDFPLGAIYLFFSGNVTSGSQRQPLQGGAGLPLGPVPGEPELVRENPEELFAPGATAVLRFRLERDSIPIPNQDLFVYTHTTSDMILSEPVRTDPSGRFEIRFVAPPAPVRLDITGAIDGTWKAFQLYFGALNRLAATVSSSDGWHFTISGKFPTQPGPWTAQLSVTTTGDAFSGPWTAASSFGPHRIVDGAEGESFDLDVSLPRFLPAGQAVTLSIWAESFRWKSDGIAHRFLVTVVTGVPIARQTDASVLVPILGLGIVIAVSASGWRWRRLSRPGRRPPEKL